MRRRSGCRVDPAAVQRSRASRPGPSSARSPGESPRSPSSSSSASVASTGRTPQNASNGVSAQSSSGFGWSSTKMPLGEAGRACSAFGWVCSESGSTQANTLRTIRERPVTSRNGVPSSSADGPFGWVPSQSSAQGRPSGSTPSRSGMNVRVAPVVVLDHALDTLHEATLSELADRPSGYASGPRSRKRPGTAQRSGASKQHATTQPPPSSPRWRSRRPGPRAVRLWRRRHRAGRAAG